MAAKHVRFEEAVAEAARRNERASAEAGQEIDPWYIEYSPKTGGWIVKKES